MSEQQSAFVQGMRDVAPAIPANVPFGVVVGVTAVGVGMSALEVVGMSMFVFAGAAQIAAIDLIGKNAPAAIVVLTVLVVNLRYVMYSASIAPYFTRYSKRWRLLLAYFLLDVDYALSVTTFAEDETADRRWYYLGTAVPIWMTWVAATTAGAVLGASVPASWQLDFAIPLLFLSLLAPAISDRRTVAAAVGGGVVAVAGAGLPFNLGLVTGALMGITAGLVAEWVGA